MVAPVLADYTYQFTDTGPVMGGGLDYDLVSIDGLDMPDVRVVEQDRDGADGSYLFAPFLKSRAITIQGGVLVPPSQAPDTFLDDLLETFQPTSIAQPFYYKHPGVVQRVVFCNSLGVRYTYNDSFNASYINFQAQLIAEDPRKYSSDPVTLPAVSLPTTSGGFAFPVVFPLTFATIIDGGTLIATNAGNKSTFPTTIFMGEVSNPVVTNLTTGVTMSFQIDLALGDQLIIDSALRTVKLNGSDRAAAIIGNRFLQLVPGQNTLFFTSANFSNTGTMSLSFRSAWW